MEASRFDQVLETRLRELSAKHLLRELRESHSAQGTVISMGGRELLNFASNDYLGLADHPILKVAAQEAVVRYGTGSGASRLICGSLQVHHDLERALAAWKGSEAALVFSSGYATAMGTICALVGREDIVVLDKLVHASIVDAARLSGAKLRVFHHNDLDDLRRILQWTAKVRGKGEVLMVTESVFSMDGDTAPLAGLVALKEEFGAWLMVDEAHGCGVYGKRHSGLVEQEGLQGKIEVQMGTLGKALGSSGGFIAGPQLLIDYLVNRARSFVFSTAPAPAASGAALKAVELLQGEEGTQLTQKLWGNVARFKNQTDIQAASPIIPVMIGSEEAALAAATGLKEHGIFVPAIRYPTVARGQARLRLSLSAAHSPDQIDQLGRVLQPIIKKA